jgi:DNA-binding cell septation regulator SpoVG
MNDMEAANQILNAILMNQYKDMSREKLMEILISKHKECDEYFEENCEFRTLLCESKKEIEELREENKNLKIDLETSQDELKQTAADLFNDIEKLEEENQKLTQNQGGYVWKSIAQTKTQTLQEFFPDYNPTFQACSDQEEIRDMLKKVFDENKALKEEVIAERKKVAEGNKDRWFVGEMWRAESVFLNMPSAKEQPEEFNDFLKEEFDEEMYKEMYEAFDLEELLEVSDEESEEESDDEA